MSLTKALIAAAGNAAPLYVDDVFSTWLYTGNGSTQTITNGIDLDGKGGLTWFKSRSAATDHQLFDTVRGATKELISNSTAAEATDADTLTAFNANGFSLGADANINTSSATYASWTFRKAPKFFDVVTYTGTGSNRTIAHDLGVAPGMIIVKRTDTTGDWQVYHRSLTSAAYKLVLNTTAAQASDSTAWNSTAPTDAVFSVGTNATVNASGGTYVAYLFAHDTRGDGIIQCGSYTGNGSATGPAVTLGWEPQWLLVKNASGTVDWNLIDNMRGFTVGGTDAELNPNLSSAESTGTFVTPTATGFQINTTDAGYNTSSSTYIYIAIRRPNKPPESGTEVFAAGNGDGAAPAFNSGFPVDMAFYASDSGGNKEFACRLTQGRGLYSNEPDAEFARASNMFDYMAGWSNSTFGATVDSWNFRRAPGFMDVVCDTGTGSAHTVAHNLAAVPELMIRKKRSAADNWIVYAGDATDYLILNDTAATADLDTMWNDTAPTASVFTVGTNDDVNQSTGTFVTYLFATLPGISKVGSYTGTGTTQTIDCGFTAGARFILIKRTDSTGDWYVYDTVRGIVAGNDPYLLLNSTAAEVTSTDYIDTVATGFEISSTAPAAINASGGTFIYLAIA